MAKREYIEANKDWLEGKAKEEGVKALPKGIFYKVLSEGRSSSARLLPEGRKNQESAKPTVRSIITAHYTGRTIDGKQFDSMVRKDAATKRHHGGRQRTGVDTRQRQCACVRNQVRDTTDGSKVR